MKYITVIIGLLIPLSTMAQTPAQATSVSPLLPAQTAAKTPVAPKASAAPKAPVAQPANDTKLLSDSYSETGNVIAFVENNLQLAQLCDERLESDAHTTAFQNWFTTQKNNFDSTLKFKFTYEKKLASLYGESIIETFKKRDRLTLKQVTNDIESIAARDRKALESSCNNWLTSVLDEKSFFHTKLSIGLIYFGLNGENLLVKVQDNRNW